MSFLSPSSPDVHPSEMMATSLQEAILSSSDHTRAALPENFRTTFDELRSGILAFCKEFSIPIEALRDKKTFGTFLVSPKIPPQRMQEVSYLFERLDHLVTHRELLLETPHALLEAERLFGLKEQYTSQVALLERVGILKEGAITGIDGKKYPIPTLEQIALRFYEQQEMLRVKHDQHFSRLLLVPFGMSLDALMDTFQQFLLDYKKTHASFDIDISKPLVRTYKGVDTGDSPKLVYFPRLLHRKNHQGKTKVQVLEDQTAGVNTTPGWRILFLQASSDDAAGFRSIPRKDQGEIEGKLSPRLDLEAFKTPIEYLSLLEKSRDNPSSPYHGESGMTPEDWLCAFMTHLTETGKLLDAVGVDIESDTWLVGAFFPSPRNVPYAGTVHNAFSGWRTRMVEFNYKFSYWNLGVRTVVAI